MNLPKWTPTLAFVLGLTAGLLLGGLIVNAL